QAHRAMGQTLFIGGHQLSETVIDPLLRHPRDGTDQLMRKLTGWPERRPSRAARHQPAKLHGTGTPLRRPGIFWLPSSARGRCGASPEDWTRLGRRCAKAFYYG